MTKKILITGGTGFVGSNLAIHYMRKGDEVYLLDNLSEQGSRQNLNYLNELFNGKFNDNDHLIVTDISNIKELKRRVRGFDVILHTAAQTAMAPSLADPEKDFIINALGTFNLLEAVRQNQENPAMLYTSTNKVYGRLEKEGLDKLVEKETRWDYPITSRFFNGVTEEFPYDIGGPYGISKSVGDKYFLEYARTFGLNTVVFRMSAICGELQYATEPHGWIGWILEQAYKRKPINIYGDGKQVRGVLHVQDLVRAMDMAITQIERTKGEAFNIGGTRENSLSVLELLALLKDKFGIGPSEINFKPWRPVDQKCYISNNEKAFKYFGWRQEISKEDAIARMLNWIKNRYKVSEKIII